MDATDCTLRVRRGQLEMDGERYGQVRRCEYRQDALPDGGTRRTLIVETPPPATP